MSITFDQAIEVAQQFLGDLGLVASSDPNDARATSKFFIIDITTGSHAIEDGTVLVVERATGAAKFVTCSPGDPDPWPDAVTAAGD